MSHPPQCSVQQADRCLRWAKRLNEAEIGHAIQHLQCIEVEEVAGKAQSHTVANRIYNLILRSFIHEVVDVPDADHDKQMADVKDEDEEGEEEEENLENEKNEEDAEDTDEDEIDDEDDRSSINNRSTYSNATSMSTSLNTLDQGFYSRQEYPPYQPSVETGTGQQMMTD